MDKQIAMISWECLSTYRESATIFMMGDSMPHGYQGGKALQNFNMYFWGEYIPPIDQIVNVIEYDVQSFNYAVPRHLEIPYQNTEYVFLTLDKGYLYHILCDLITFYEDEGVLVRLQKPETPIMVPHKRKNGTYEIRTIGGIIVPPHELSDNTFKLESIDHEISMAKLAEGMLRANIIKEASFHDVSIVTSAAMQNLAEDEDVFEEDYFDKGDD